MKTLEEIRKETEDYMWTTFESMMVVAVKCDDYKLINKLINQFAINVAKEALKNASEKMEYEYSDYEETPDFSLILNESNIPNI